MQTGRRRKAWAWLGGAKVVRCVVIYEWSPEHGGPFAGRVELPTGKAANALLIRDTEAEALRAARHDLARELCQINRELARVKQADHVLARRQKTAGVDDLFA